MNARYSEGRVLFAPLYERAIGLLLSLSIFARAAARTEGVLELQSTSLPKIDRIPHAL